MIFIDQTTSLITYDDIYEDFLEHLLKKLL